MAAAAAAVAQPAAAPAADVPAHLLRWVTPDETAAEFFRRQSREATATGLPFIDAHIQLRPGHILELCGPTGSAKSELLVQVAAHLLCTTSHLQGNDQEHVVLVDCDGKFDGLRLIQVLGINHPNPLALLPRFHLVRCFNTLELLLALNSLPQQLAAFQGRCRLLLLDNIAAHLWHDKAAVFSAVNQQLPFGYQQQQGPAGWQQGIAHQQALQQPWAGQQQFPPPYPQQQQQQQQQQQHAQQQQGASSSAHGPEQRSPGFDALRVQAAIAALLQALSQQWRVPVIMTKQTGVSQADRSGTPRLVQREVLTAALQGAVSHRLLLMPATQSLHQPGATVLLQWQAGDYAGQLQRCLIGSQAVQVL